MHPEIRDAVVRQGSRFKDKFSREIGPKDQILFDSDAGPPKPFDLTRLEAGTVKAMIEAGISPEYIYGYRKTGLIASESNWARLRSDDRRAWQEAIREYFAITGKSEID